MDEAEQIRRFIAERGVTRCRPKRASAPSPRRLPRLVDLTEKGPRRNYQRRAEARVPTQR
jgi:hypothetical protein